MMSMLLSHGWENGHKTESGDSWRRQRERWILPIEEAHPNQPEPTGTVSCYLGMGVLSLLLLLLCILFLSSFSCWLSLLWCRMACLHQRNTGRDFCQSASPRVGLVLTLLPPLLLSSGTTAHCFGKMNTLTDESPEISRQLEKAAMNAAKIYIHV